jgi:hypothetical protein
MMNLSAAVNALSLSTSSGKSKSTEVSSDFGDQRVLANASLRHQCRFRLYAYRSLSRYLDVLGAIRNVRENFANISYLALPLVPAWRHFHVWN